MRLPVYDYASPGAYFVTICAHRRRLLFEDPRIHEVIDWAWRAIPEHFANTEIDSFVIMPNHFHGVVLLNETIGTSVTVTVGAQHAGRLRLHASHAPLGVIVRSFKAAVTREIRIRGLWDSRPFWQPNYYDRVVRDEAELNRVREYIAYNPIAWQYDHENSNRLLDEEHVRRWAWLEDAATG